MKDISIRLAGRNIGGKIKPLTYVKKFKNPNGSEFNSHHPHKVKVKENENY